MGHRKVPNWAFSGEGQCVRACVYRNFPIICINYWPYFSEALQYRRRQKLSQPEEKWLSHHGEHGRWLSRVFLKTGWLEARIMQVEMNREGGENNKSLLKDTIKNARSILMLTVFCRSQECILCLLSFSWWTWIGLEPWTSVKRKKQV